MQGREFVSRITASRIALIRKSLYSSRIFEEKWTVKRMRFFQDLGVNLKHSPLPGLSLRHAVLPSFSSPGKSFSFKIVYYAPPPTPNKPKMNSLLLLLGINYFSHSFLYHRRASILFHAVCFGNGFCTAIKIAWKLSLKTINRGSMHRRQTLLLFNDTMSNKRFFFFP